MQAKTASRPRSHACWPLTEDKIDNRKSSALLRYTAINMDMRTHHRDSFEHFKVMQRRTDQLTSAAPFLSETPVPSSVSWPGKCSRNGEDEWEKSDCARRARLVAYLRRRSKSLA